MEKRHVRDHPFKTSALLGWGGQIVPNLPTNSSKKLPTEAGRVQKSWTFADVFNGCSLSKVKLDEVNNPQSSFYY